jgi:hypothetical protein
MVTARQAGLVALLGLIPTAAYAVQSPEVFPYVAILNTVLIAAAVYLMLSPVGAEQTASSA